jgi:hypothetical protein
MDPPKIVVARSHPYVLPRGVSTNIENPSIDTMGLKKEIIVTALIKMQPATTAIPEYLCDSTDSPSIL